VVSRVLDWMVISYCDGKVVCVYPMVAVSSSVTYEVDPPEMVVGEKVEGWTEYLSPALVVLVLLETDGGSGMVSASVEAFRLLYRLRSCVGSGSIMVKKALVVKNKTRQRACLRYNKYFESTKKYLQVTAEMMHAD
jgi:hypothetical protein